MRNRKAEERTALREQYWAGEKAWTGEGSKGWFRGPRTLPLVLALLRMKQMSGNTDPSTVYLGLWARHFDSGVVEITNEAEMAYEAGYTGSRALRTWQERMRLLEELGFIKSRQVANQRYRYVLLLDPSVAVAGVVKKKMVSDQQWLDTYEARRLSTGEKTAVLKKVVSITRGTTASKSG